MIISAIVAIGEQRQIGKDNKLLWNIKEDMKKFVSLTRGHTVIMGRKTYESIGFPLKKRRNIIITRNSDYKVEGAFICHSLKEAIELASKEGESEAFICGGAQIYEDSLPLLNRLYLSKVSYRGEADTFFPEFNEDDFKVIEHQKFETSTPDGIAWEHLVLSK